MSESRIVARLETNLRSGEVIPIVVEEIDGGDGGYRVFAPGGVLGNGDDERIHEMLGDAMADAAEEVASIVSEDV